MDVWDLQDTPTSRPTKEIKKEDDIVLTELQKKIILDRWSDESKNPPSIQDLLKLAFPNLNLDGRSKQAMLIKEVLPNPFESDKKLSVKTGQNKNIELNEEHKEYIRNNCSNMKPMEIARVLFGTRLAPASLEARKVIEFYKTLNTSIITKDEVVESLYTPPANIERVVTRIKKYIKETEDWDTKKLTPRQKKQSESLFGYLHSFRFKYQMDTYEDPSYKELFESSFIKYCYDKDDLTQENIDQYILLCSEIVNLSEIQKTISLLQSEQDRSLAEEGKMSMTVVEAIKTATQQRNECVKKQQDLYKSLTQERSDKLSEEIKDKASLLNLVNLWKNEETRKQMIAIANERKKKLGDEIDRLESMDDLRVRLVGISRNEILEN